MVSFTTIVTVLMIILDKTNNFVIPHIVMYYIFTLFNSDL